MNKFTPIFTKDLIAPQGIHQFQDHDNFTLLGGFSCEGAIIYCFLNNQPRKFEFDFHRGLSLGMTVNGVPVSAKMPNVEKYKKMEKEFHTYLGTMDLWPVAPRKGKNPIEGNLEYYLKFPENQDVIIIPFYHEESIISIIESFGIDKGTIGTIPDRWTNNDLVTIPLNFENILNYGKIVSKCKDWCKVNFPEFFI